MTQQGPVRRTAEALPLPVLCALPALVALLVAALAPERAVALLVLVALAGAALGAVLSSQLRSPLRAGLRVSRDVSRVQDRLAAERRRRLLLEKLLEARETSSDTSLARTRALLAELVGAEETTRSYIAAELHDTVAQTLSQALRQLELGDTGGGTESVADGERQLRAVLSRLRPPELDDGDLARAVADLCAEMQRRYAVAVEVRWPEESISLPGPVATTVYRFLQEALLNAAVHADGVDVRLAVGVEDTVLVATVSDGGAGFDPEAVVSVAGRHVGLHLARERARLAGGLLRVDSVVGAGTTVQLRLPLVERRSAPRSRDAVPRQAAVSRVAATG